MLNFVRLSCLGLLLASPTIPGGAETAALARSQPRLAYDVSLQQPPAPAGWSRTAAEDLLAYVEGVGSEGLYPAAYEPERLRAAIHAGDEAALTGVADEIFLRLTSDLSGGYVRGERGGWRMDPTGINGHEQQRLLQQVRRSGGVFDALNPLLPTHAQYVGLRRALAATQESDEARRDLIRTNMERWRWMPRELGKRHVIVNVPAFTAAVVEDGAVVARHKVIVGKPNTPTVQFSAMATGVTLNPWWTVPQSIIPELGSMRGYEVRRGDGHLIVRQPPGPNNSLGRVKIEMPNSYAIYLHDTPAQALFGRDVRAFSHGCIRTQGVRDFAAILLAPNGDWDRKAIDRAIATGKTTLVELAEPVPIHVAYFTAAATGGGEIVTYKDLYGRDRQVRLALKRRGTGGTAEGG